MDTIGAIKARIKRLCFENDITLNKLANLCGISPSSIKNIMYGKSSNPKILTIKMICDGLNITLAEFFNTKEFNNLEQELK
ncbi:MAG: helix-turn-helix transcriptional regulator [Clostridia bacterium]|nr:helix-turn-helix transcriptional regulator [Clostridia bacterium]